ncbi:MAG: CvpA family protein [Bacteroidales bacterium]|nr:CvpA family protein [Bacteroidales bacterium]
MNIVDIILLICFIPALIQGFRKGFISQVIAIISIILGVWLSFRFSSSVSVWLAQYIQGSEQIMKLISFALILIAVIAGLTVLGRLIEGTFKLVMLGWLNRLLGVAFSLLKAGLVVGLAIMAFCSLNNTFGLVSEDTLNQSVLFPPLKDLAYTVFPYLKELISWNK